MTNYFGIVSFRCGTVTNSLAMYTCGPFQMDEQRLDDLELIYNSSAFCGDWVDLQWGRSWHTQLTRSNKVKAIVQCFRMSRAGVCQIVLVIVIQFTTHLSGFIYCYLALNLYFHSVKYFQNLLFNIIISIQHYAFVYTQINYLKYLYATPTFNLTSAICLQTLNNRTSSFDPRWDLEYSAIDGQQIIQNLVFRFIFLS